MVIMKLKTSVGVYKLSMPMKGCILVTAKSQYDINMLFARYQEFYESENPKVRHKHITFAELMRAYAKQWKKDTFTYPEDWAGFNLPDVAIEKCLSGITDFNPYDTLMSRIYGLMYNEDGEKFYVIGVVEPKTKSQMSTLNHEIAHGLYYLDAEYKREMNKLTFDVLPKRHLKTIFKKLKEWGYDRSVYYDEVQALMIEKKPHDFIAKINKKYRKQYRDVFKVHKKLNSHKIK